LSWLKKMFGRFKDDDFHLDETSYLEERHIDKPKPNDNQKEIEARVSYQYPKGEFRFPIIPDQRETGSQERVKRSEQRRQRRSNSLQEEAPVEKEVNKPKEKPKQEKKIKKDEAARRPFRPTEIPSPIYGFSKPVKKEEDPIPFELKSSEPRRWPGIEVPSVQDKNTDVENNSLEESVESSFEAAEPVTDAPNEAAVDRQEETVESLHTDSSSEGSPIVVLQDPEVSEEESPVLLTEAEDDIPSETEFFDKQEEEKAPEWREAEASEDYPVIEDQTIEEGPDEDTPGETPAEEEAAPAAEPASKRSHLPFNVLMLKQDKRMIDRNKRFDQLKNERVSEQKEDRPPEPDALAADEVVYEEEIPAVETKIELQPVLENAEPEEAAHTQAQLAETGVQTETIEEESVKGEEPDQKKPESRAHLPFNVLMLKQDKRKTAVPDQEVSVSPSVKNVKEEKLTDETSVKKYEELADQPVQEEGYSFPQLNFLSPPVSKESSVEWLEAQRELLNDTLVNFNVRARVVNVTEGPAVTRFEVQPEPGVKVNKITNLADDIKLSLAARDIRIEAPIPGKHTIGIEVPNKQSRPVALSEIISSAPFQESSSALTAALGLDISGEPIVTDLNKMPHGLIAGATGSGKSVCINSILVSLLYKASPQDLKLLLIDPKMVELAPYNRMPHLVSPVITDVKAATAALKWAVEEMERRYELFAHSGVRDISRYNLKAERNGEKSQKLPYLVIVIDELADLMMMSPADVEEAICRIAQKARACGIHLIIATQRPSVDVITGLIKANVPTRIAFSVSSGVDSRTIIDSSGAERLLGRGDMLFLENGSSKPVRLQGTFVSDDEIDDIVSHVREQGEPDYLFQQDELLKKAQVDEQEDELFLEACEFVVNQGGASTSLIQRHFRVGYNRAARLVDMMESHGIVSEAKGSKPRDVLISSRELEELQDTSTII
jgi:DNA segregation ATPase FtsK/SpoIIIE, S-DNA-T family